MSCLKDFIRIKQVGKGSFGIAWLVESKINSKKYVIKELGHKEMSERERIDARKEVMLLSKMNHANIVSYLNSFEEGGRVHILMEFCENGDLGARIKAQSGVLFKEDQILEFFVQICLGIKHIHDSKILHRDIKPQNIFLTKTNVVKLGDFGIAKLMNSTTAFTNTTVGTPFYFSPELCSRRMYNNKSDIWSLGCVLYEMCTLNHAFSAQEMAILALRIKNVSYKPISVNYSTGLRYLIGTIFQRDPRERPNINEILKKPFISRIFEKNFAPNTRPVLVKDVTPRKQSPVITGRVDSGVNNRKVINKENLIANSPYLPQAKKPMLKRPENNRVNPLVAKKNDILKKGRAAMMINDRENAWKNILSSKDDPEQKAFSNDQREKPVIKTPGIYDHYFADLERLKQQQELREAEGKQLMHRFQRISDDEISDGVYRKIDPTKNNIQMGANAADRDRLVQEYWDNKQRAIHNRNRDGVGVGLALCGPKKIEQRVVPLETPLNREDEMADRLNKIRQQHAEERRIHNIGDCALNFDKNKGVIVNRENARAALEDLQKKIKLRSEELQQKLELKRFEKENVQDSDVQNRQNNVILFPKRAEPVELDQRVKNGIAKVNDPQMTSILEQLKNVRPVDEDIKVAWGQREDLKVPSLSVVLDRLREKPCSPRPVTAPPLEVLEIKKKKNDILKRLNSNKLYLENVEENPQRKSWAMNFDDNLLMKDESSNNFDNTLSDTYLMDGVSVLSENEEPSLGEITPVEREETPNGACKSDAPKSIWAQNNENMLNIMIEESSDTIKMEYEEAFVHPDNTLVSLREADIVIEPSIVAEDSSEADVDEILSTSVDIAYNPPESNDVQNEAVSHGVALDAWVEKGEQKTCLPRESLSDDGSEHSSSEDDLVEVSRHMEKVLDIRASSSSEDEVTKHNLLEETKDESEDSVPVVRIRSLPDLLQFDDLILKRIKSESDITNTFKDEYSSGSSGDGTEDFCDDKAEDENIFLKIEVIRNKLETEIGLDPLIDAMEFVRESQDLDGDDLAAKLRDMLNHNEEAVNDIFHLVVLEEQYNNMD